MFPLDHVLQSQQESAFPNLRAGMKSLENMELLGRSECECRLNGPITSVLSQLCKQQQRVPRITSQTLFAVLILCVARSWDCEQFIRVYTPHRTWSETLRRCRYGRLVPHCSQPNNASSLIHLQRTNAVFHLWKFELCNLSITTALNRTSNTIDIRRGCNKDTRGTAYVVYEDIYDAKNACDHLSGFNVANRYLIVLYYNPQRMSKKVRRPAASVMLSLGIRLCVSMLPRGVSIMTFVYLLSQSTLCQHFFHCALCTSAGTCCSTDINITTAWVQHMRRNVCTHGRWPWCLTEMNIQSRLVLHVRALVCARGQ